MASPNEILLKKLYFGLEQPGSYSGIDVLYLAAKKQSPTITRREVREFLLKQNVYLRHLRPKKPKFKNLKFPRFVVSNKNLNWQCDSGQFKHSKLKYMQVCVDQFTGKVMAKCQRNLKAKTTSDTIQKIIDQQNNGTKPLTIRTDLGTEYKGLEKALDINHSVTHGRFQKAFLSEKAISRIRAKLNKYSTDKGRLADVSTILPKILTSINESPNTITKLSPNEASELKNAGIVFNKRYAKYLKDKLLATKNPKFPVGSFVRIHITEKSPFYKKSLPGFSSEVYRVTGQRDTYPVTYEIVDAAGDKVRGYFHERDLITSEPDFKKFRVIDKTIDRRTLANGKNEYLVNFIGHNKKYTEWLNQVSYDQLKLPLTQRK